MFRYLIVIQRSSSFLLTFKRSVDLHVIRKLSTKEVVADVVFKGVGAITESDVSLANSSKGFIVGFNVRAIPQARDTAKRDGVDIRYYSIIYNLIDDMKKLMGGLLAPNLKEEITGNVEVREIFKISKLSIS